MNRYVKSLDGVRAIAVLLVMLFHYRIYDFGSAGIGVGWIGVQLFFVLSGFLITRILLEEKKNKLGFYLKKFYWRRSLRIFPLYFGYLFAISVIFFITRQPSFLGDKLPFLYTYTFNFTRLLPDWKHSPLYTHLWSLSVEEQFYVVWPFFIYFLSGRALKIGIAGILILTPVFRWFLGYYLINYSSLEPEAVGEAIYWFTFSHIDAFAIGGAITVFDFENKIKKPSYVLLGSGLVLGIAGLLNALAIRQHDPYFEISSLGFPIGGMNYMQHVWSYTLLNIAFAALILILLAHQDKKSIFTNQLLVSIGRVSYGMYLFHWAILAAFSKAVEKLPVAIHSLILFTFYFFLVYGLALLSYQLYEKRFLKLKDRLYNKKKHQNNRVLYQTDSASL